MFNLKKRERSTKTSNLKNVQQLKNSIFCCCKHLSPKILHGLTETPKYYMVYLKPKNPTWVIWTLLHGLTETPKYYMVYLNHKILYMFYLNLKNTTWSNRNPKNTLWFIWTLKYCMVSLNHKNVWIPCTTCTRVITVWSIICTVQTWFFFFLFR